MSFIGKNGFFGPLKSFTGWYHPSAYSRGGVSKNGTGTLGKSFAYKRPQFDDGGGVTGNNVLPRYAKRPVNNASNDSGSTYQAAHGSNDYSFGKVSPRFQNFGAEVTPTGHNNVKRRGDADEDYLTPAQRRAYESREHFRRGGAAVTQPWRDQPYHIKQRTRVGSGAPRIHVPHSGQGLVMSIHLSDVGPHAISVSHSGGVDASRMMQRQAAHALQAYGPPATVPRHASAPAWPTAGALATTCLRWFL